MPDLTPGLLKRLKKVLTWCDSDLSYIVSRFPSRLPKDLVADATRSYQEARALLAEIEGVEVQQAWLDSYTGHLIWNTNKANDRPVLVLRQKPTREGE